MTPTTTYVQRLPTDVLLKILQLTDDPPRWNSTHLYQIRPKTAVWDAAWERRAALFFAHDTPFRTAAASLFRRVRACAGYKFRLDAGDGTMELGVTDPTKDSSHGFVQQALRACGPHLKAVELGHNITANADYSRFLKLLIKHCTNVENVKLHIRKDSAFVLNDYSELLRRVGPQLRTLSWYCENGVDLDQFDFSRFVSLKEFTFQGERLSLLRKQLEAFGATLEKLVVCCMDTTADWGSTLDTIRETCPNLTAICVELDEVCSVVGTERYTSFLASYGEQLVDARVEGLVPHQLARVASACPNLRFSLRIEGESDRWEALNALSPHLRDIQIRLFRDDSVDLGFFDRTIAKCEGLDRMSVYLYNMKITENSDVMLKSMFSSSRHVLEDFQFHPIIVSPWSIGLVASNTSHLRKFDIEAMNYIEDGTIFQDVAEANPLLEQVKVFEKHQAGVKREVQDTVEIVEQLVQSFLECGRLNKLDLRIFADETPFSEEEMKNIVSDVREQIGEICRPLKNRGISHRIWLFKDHHPFSADGGGEPGTD